MLRVSQVIPVPLALAVQGARHWHRLGKLNLKSESAAEKRAPGPDFQTAVSSALRLAASTSMTPSRKARAPGESESLLVTVLLVLTVTRGPAADPPAFHCRPSSCGHWAVQGRPATVAVPKFKLTVQ
jgi:hypothetical protein